MTLFLDKFRRIVVLNLFLLIGYIGLAFFAKNFFANSVLGVSLWPAAGLANAMCLFFGFSLLPAVFFGNFIGGSWSPDFGFVTHASLFAVALGTTIQTAFVAVSARFLGCRFALPTDLADILLFLLVFGPLGCWFSALSFFLVSRMQLGFGDLNLYSSFFWWIGDSIGSLVLGPTVLYLLQRAHQPQGQNQRDFLLPQLLFISLLPIISTGLSSYLGKSLVDDQSHVAKIHGLQLLLSINQLFYVISALGLVLLSNSVILSFRRRLDSSLLASDAAGTVLHEISQPLLRLRMGLDQLVRGYSRMNSEALAEGLGQASLESESLAKLTQSMRDLALSGIQDSLSADLTLAIKMALAQVQPTLDGFDQSLSVSLIDPAVFVQCGQIQLQCILRNLFANATVAANESGVIRISASTRHGFVEVCVEDSGPGLPFASSEIGRRPLISASGGMGIGLMIVRRFIDAANGRLEIGRSVALGGARISLFLPIVR